MSFNLLKYNRKKSPFFGVLDQDTKSHNPCVEAELLLWVTQLGCGILGLFWGYSAPSLLSVTQSFELSVDHSKSKSLSSLSGSVCAGTCRHPCDSVL